MKACSVPLLAGVIGALLLVTFGVFTKEAVLFAFALATLAVGFGAGSLMVASKIEKKMTAVNSSVEQIESLQKEMKALIQEGQQGSGRPILATLEGLSQYYLDYMKKQKEQGEQTEEE